MASLTESSVGSVPLAQLQQIQEELLKTNVHAHRPLLLDQDAADEADKQHTHRGARQGQIATHAAFEPLAESTATEPCLNAPTATQVGRGSGDDQHVTARSEQATKAAQTASVQKFHTPPTSVPARQSPPPPSSVKSAPELHMEPSLQPSPSQRAFAELTRGVSFNGYPGGDTQLMESQVYRDFTKSMIQNAAPSSLDNAQFEQLSTRETDDVGRADTYKEIASESLKEGDTGYVDLAGAWRPDTVGGSPTQESLQADDVGFDSLLLPSDGTQLQVAPETPALVGCKRDARGEIITSVATTRTKTPGLSQFFGPVGAPLLSATQLFNQTQAPTSPITGGLRSDPITSRPSPNLRTSSSPPILRPSSSPATSMHEPRERYTSRRESQERRAARLRYEQGLQQVPEEDEDDDDDDFDDDLPLYHPIRPHRVMSDHTMAAFAKFKAPMRSSSGRSSGPARRTTIDLVTPQTVAKRSVENDDDIFLEEPTPLRVMQAEHSVDILEGDEGDQHDVYDEYSQTVLRSQCHDHDENDRASQSSDGHAEQSALFDRAEARNSSPDPLADDMPHARATNAAATNNAHDDGITNTAYACATPHSAIANSVPATQEQPRSIRQAKPVGPDSSMSSIVPGSQYVMQTTMDEAKRRTHRSSQRSFEPPGETLQQSTNSRTARRSICADSAGSAQAQRMSDQFVSAQSVPGATHQEDDTSVRNLQHRDNSNATEAPFSSAKSQMHGQSNSPSMSRSFQMLQSRSNQHTPRKANGILHFADIANGPSTPQASGETEVDVDAIMGDVMTAEDHEFIRAVSSQPSQTRKSRANTVPHLQILPSSNTEVPREQESAGIGRTTIAAIQNWNDPASVNVQPDATVYEEQGSLDPQDVLRTSPSKANEQPKSTPVTSKNSLSQTPDSVKRREEAGKNAVSQLIRSRTAQQPRSIKGTRNKTAMRRSRLPNKLNSHKLLDLSGGIDADAGGENLQPQEVDTLEREVRPTGNATPGCKMAAGPLVCAPNRVFALFKGSYNHFYPATYLGSSPGRTSHKVRFEDGNTATVEHHHVRPLEIRLGDLVKVDIREMRSKTWRVTGFGKRTTTDPSLFSDSLDIHGHDTLRVQAKTGRTSLPSAELDELGDGEAFEVPVAGIYLTYSMWARYHDRPFTNIKVVELPGSDLRTPDPTSLPISARATETPPSKGRRTSGMSRAPSHVREPSAASSCGRASKLATGTPAFVNKAFAISYTSNHAEKEEVTRLIRADGGLVLENGFDELFDSPDLDSSPSQGLTLKPEFKDLEFVALIADKHSRRAKYMQALALGLPTLSGRFIVDSIDNNRRSCAEGGESTTLPWLKYLLPAGESAYLGGAVRSRTIPASFTECACVADIVDRRGRLLDGDGVLLVAPNDKTSKGKGLWEKRKAYAFLTLALGAGSVLRVTDIQEARECLKQCNGDKTWSWVYVDGDVVAAANELSDTRDVKAGVQGKKRKRDSSTIHARKGDIAPMCKDVERIKVVNDEFVVQSLILSALVD